MFPISIPVAAAAAASSYGAQPTWIAAPAGLIMRVELGSVRAVKTKVDGVTVIAVPGTDSVSVFLLDFKIAKVHVTNHREMGQLHQGFALAAEALARVIELEPDEPYVLTAHSFGGAVVQPLALMLPHLPLGILGLAPARPFADVVPAQVQALTTAFRFGNDPVPDEPGWFPSVACRPIGVAAENPLDCHHAAGYVAALDAILPTGVSSG